MKGRDGIKAGRKSRKRKEGRKPGKNQ